MTTNQIEELFNVVIKKRGIHTQLQGISKDKIYNWRKDRIKKPSVGEMIDVLYQLGKIKISKNIDSIAICGDNSKPELIEDKNGNIKALAKSERPNPNRV